MDNTFDESIKKLNETLWITIFCLIGCLFLIVNSIITWNADFNLTGINKILKYLVVLLNGCLLIYVIRRLCFIIYLKCIATFIKSLEKNFQKEKD